MWPALGLALAGLAVILLPDLLGEGVKVSIAGLLAALFTGFGYATYTVSVKGLTKIVAPSTISMAEAAGDTLFVLPLALWQSGSTGYQLDRKAWIAAIVMGVLCTAIPYTLWIEGTQRVRVEHVTTSATSSRSRDLCTRCSCRPVAHRMDGDRRGDDPGGGAAYGGVRPRRR